VGEFSRDIRVLAELTVFVGIAFLLPFILNRNTPLTLNSVKINDPPFHPAFSKTFNSAVYDVIRDPKSNIVTYTPVPKLGDNS